MNKAISILSTKKLKPALIKEAEVIGLNIFDVDFINIAYHVNELVAKSLSHIREYLVFTSQHGVKGFIMNKDQSEIPFQQLKIYCLENETLKAAEKISNSEIISTAKDAISLSKKIIADKVKEVSFICGNRRRDDLPDMLTGHQIIVEEIEVYKTQYNCHTVKQDYSAILFFSPSAVESFFKTNVLQEDVSCFCIGATTASAVKNHTKNSIIIAESSTQESILETVELFLKNKIIKDDDVSKRNNAVSASDSKK